MSFYGILSLTITGEATRSMSALLSKSLTNGKWEKLLQAFLNVLNGAYLLEYNGLYVRIRVKWEAKRIVR